MTTRQRVLLSSSAAIALFLGLMRCAGSDRAVAPMSQDSVAHGDVSSDAGASNAAPGVALSAAPDAASATSAGSDVAAKNAPLAESDAGTDAALPSDPRSNPTAALLHASDVADRDLLADVERLTKKAPPATVGELIAMHHKGATRAELAQFIKQSFGTHVALRTSAERWLEQVSPSGRPQAPAAPSMQSSGEPNVKHPIRMPAKP